MRIQVVNGYLNLVDQKKAPTINCGNDPQHGRVFARLGDDDQIELWCLACNYRAVVGLAMYDSMYEICWVNRAIEGE